MIHNLEMRGITVKWWMRFLPERFIAAMVARELVGPEGPWPGVMPGDGTCTLKFSLAGSKVTYEVKLKPSRAALLRRQKAPWPKILALLPIERAATFWTAVPCSELRSLP